MNGRKSLILTGFIAGAAAILLQYLGNPANMGFCMACFIRDTAGSMGLHSAAIVQYIRPEVIGLVLGALVVALLRGEFKPRSGSNVMIRFFLGMFAMIGALLFLGCPWRALLRLAGGDWNAIIGIAGLVAGVAVGAQFVKRGYSLSSPNKSESKTAGYIMPILFVGLFLMLIFNFSQLKFSTTGPGASHAPIFISFAIALLIGGLAQFSRFCTVGAIRNIFVTRNLDMFFGIIVFTLTALIANILFGSFNAGFEGQPVAHSQAIPNFLGMALSGLAFVLAGGCPGRQLIMVGEGNSDAGIFIVGMLFGGGLAHNFALASSPKGATDFGIIATVIGIVFCLIVGYIFTRKVK